VTVDLAKANAPDLSSDLLNAYVRAFEASWSDETPVEKVRFVSLDTEATGLDPKRDRVITIGAVGILDGQIDLADAFEVMLKVAYNQSAVTVHGVTRDEAQDGMDEREAIEAFLGYLGDGVIVGHHIGFDIEMLNLACERHFGIKLMNRSLDTMDLTLHLQDGGAFQATGGPNGFTLDALCALFGVAPRDRHTAGGDAFITALVFLRLLRLARKTGRHKLADLTVPYATEKDGTR
jgi:DNA polymerase III subunit epsilon